MASSSASSTCRIDWRPSRWLLAGLGMLGPLAALSLLWSGLPVAWAWPGAALAAALGLHLARREARRAPLRVEVAAGGVRLHPPQGAPVPLADPCWQVRGRFAWLRGRDGQGRRHCLAWGPDTLGPTSLRELQLARGAGPSAVPHPLVAP